MLLKILFLTILTVILAFKEPTSAEKEAFRNQMRNYGKCLRDKEEKFQNMKEKAELHVVEETRFLRLKCNICRRPDREEEDYELSLRWYQQLVHTNMITMIWIDNTKFTLDGLDLLLNKPKLEDGGEYWCMDGPSMESLYLVDVVPEAEAKTVYLSKKPKPYKNLRIDSEKLTLTPRWSKWGQCNVCNKSGKRARFGMCVIKSTSRSYELRGDKAVLKTFKNIPCSSNLLSPRLRKIIIGAPNLLLIGDCFEECKPKENKEPIRVIQLEIGQTPKLPRRVIRKSVYTSIGKQLMLVCPHGEDRGTLVRWQNGTETMSYENMTEQTLGRVIIDYQYRLLYMFVTRYDKEPISCYVGDRHVSSWNIHLSVKTEVSWYHRLATFVGMILFVITLLYIGYRAIINSRRKTLR